MDCTFLGQIHKCLASLLNTVGIVNITFSPRTNDGAESKFRKSNI